MNAYELADQVEMWGEDLLALNMKGGIPVVQGAKMLRQQADRIAELERRIEEVKKVNGEFAELIVMQREHAEELRKEILMWENAEVPVEVMTELIAELQRKGLIEKVERCDPICRPSACNCVKRKPLTDEEIEQCFADACTDFKLLENGKTKGIVNLIDVGRAIEKRHGIK